MISSKSTILLNVMYHCEVKSKLYLKNEKSIRNIESDDSLKKTKRRSSEVIPWTSLA